jgi:hypothetical protein
MGEDVAQLGLIVVRLPIAIHGDAEDHFVLAELGDEGAERMIMASASVRRAITGMQGTAAKAPVGMRLKPALIIRHRNVSHHQNWLPFGVFYDTPVFYFSPSPNFLRTAPVSMNSRRGFFFATNRAL